MSSVPVPPAQARRTPAVFGVGCAALLGACGPVPQPAQIDCGTPGAICRVVGVDEAGARGFEADGLPARETMLNMPTSLTFDPEGRLVFADFNNQRIRRVEADGTVITIAGNGFHGYATLGAEATDSTFENPVELVYRDDGTLLIAELHIGRVVQIDELGLIAPYVGTGNLGYGGDDGPANLATLSQSYGLALGDDGTLYIADTDNHCIRAVSAEPEPIEGYDVEARQIRTTAGAGVPGLEDGEGHLALFRRPHHITWHDGALYVADAGNHSVRRFDPETGAVETIAGTGEAGYAGDGGPATEAQLFDPTGVAVGEDGTVYVADRGNHLIRAIDPDGTISTLAGQYVLGEQDLPVGGFAGERSPADEARLSMPENVVIGPDGHLYVADMLNSMIRKIAL